MRAMKEKNMESRDNTRENSSDGRIKELGKLRLKDESRRPGDGEELCQGELHG